MSDKQFDIPAIAQSVDAAVRNPFTRMREAIQTLLGLRGDGLDAAMTFRGAQTIGLLDSTGAPTSISPTADLTAPPTVTGLTVTAGFANVFVEWDAALYTQGHGHGQTNLYAAKKASTDPTLPVFADAVRVFDAMGALTLAALPSDLSIRWHVWAKWQTADGVESVAPAGGTNGVSAQTGLIGNGDVSDLAIDAAKLAAGAVDLLSGKVVASASFGAIAVGYTVTQYLLTTSGVMGNLIVDNAQIANLDASKLTVGSGAIGGNLRSTSYVSGSVGWQIQPNGYAEFNNVVIRGATYTGTIYAGAGSIGGITINTTNLRSSGYVAGVSGFSIDNASGSAEFNSVTVRGAVYSSTGAIDGAILNPASVVASKLSVTSLDAITATIGLLRTATSGARVEIASNYGKVFDASNVKRVQWGDLTA